MLPFRGVHKYLTPVPLPTRAAIFNALLDRELFVGTLPSDLERSARTPVILFVDNHWTHTTAANIVNARQLHIVLVGLPENTTNELQPLDKHGFLLVKHMWKKTLLRYGVAGHVSTPPPHTHTHVRKRAQAIVARGNVDTSPLTTISPPSHPLSHMHHLHALLCTNPAPSSILPASPVLQPQQLKRGREPTLGLGTLTRVRQTGPGCEGVPPNKTPSQSNLV